MVIYYLTNISDPILKVDKKYRKSIRSLLVSERYASAFKNSDNKSSDFDFFLSDNGNFTRLTKIAKNYTVNAKEINDALDELEKDKKPLPAALINKRKKLNAEVIESCKEEARKNDFTKITFNQLEMNPHAIIGAEDTTIPVLQITGAFDARLKNNIPDIFPYQNKTLSLYSKQYKGEFGGETTLKKIKKYLVIHAIDYNSMVKALKNIGELKHDGIAISLGGPLESNRYLKDIKIGNETIKFDNTHPERYILSIALLLALRKNISKKKRIHILGLGTPILILLAGYVFKDFKFVTIDSTATFQDVEADKVYGNKYGLSKMDLFKLAAACIVNKYPFKGISPYYKNFENKFKSDWNKLNTHFKTTINNKNIDHNEKLSLIQLELKKNPKLLKDNIPFFTPMKLADKSMVKELRIARSFENYWINNSICTKLNSFSTSNQISKYVLDEVTKYTKLNNKNYVDAILECMNLIKKY